ncbi:MAG: LacI family DNA-binding transcriptional regulator, partial [Spirochaetaceae bacterium]|nr:LacI family DNA-binding transcriptional regulator [Spirochaetaceae bacterium]
ARAGVTVTTVSRFLNKRGYMSEATRGKIALAMSELGYVPNEIARSLFRQKSSIIGLIIPTANHPFFGELTSSVEFHAYEAGYKTLLCNSRLDRDKEKGYVEMLKRHKVDGIIMASHTLEVDEYRGLGMPIVTMDRKIGDDIPYVTSDNYAGGTLAARRLLARGCRKLAYFSGNLTLDLLPNKRCDAFLAETGADGAEAIVIQTDFDVFDFSQYATLVSRLFEEHPDIDGVFASDVKAAHVLQACNRLRRRVPEDIKIVGYDDVLIASLLVPRLTTIRQPIEEMGKRAVATLIAQIEGASIPMANVLPVSLIERESA